MTSGQHSPGVSGAKPLCRLRWSASTGKLNGVSLCALMGNGLLACSASSMWPTLMDPRVPMMQNLTKIVRRPFAKPLFHWARLHEHHQSEIIPVEIG